jgi:hypothetical protein
VCSAGSLLDKKYIKHIAVLTEEKLDRTGAGLHLRCKSLTLLAEQKQVSIITEWRGTKKLHLWLYKIRKVHVCEEGDYKGTHFTYNWFFLAAHGSILDPKLTFLADEGSLVPYERVC